MNEARGNYRRAARRCATCLGAFFAVACPAPSLFAGSPPEPRSAARFGLSVRVALRRAARKLEHPGCQLVYGDFKDPRGMTLQEGLTERGSSGAAHFLGVVFEDGDRMAVCQRGGILAYTSPGSGTVRLCTANFTKALHADSEVAVATLIHEQLHTLGLLENPPTSLEITERVLQRCGR
jgi:hypothetical protein